MSFLWTTDSMHHHVAAANEVELREWRVVDQVLSGENAYIADGLIDLVTPVDFNEVAPQSIWRDIEGDVLRIDSGASFVNALIVEISGEDLYRNALGPPSNIFQPTDGHGVCLLAR